MVKSIENLYDDVLKWIGDMILRGQIWLRDVPQNIRQSSQRIYICAFRADRSGSCYRFLSDVQVLCEDIIMLYDNDNRQKAALIELLYDTLQLSDYKGDERFETFRKNIDENLLRELQEYEYSHGRKLQTAIRKFIDKNGTERS